jgi:hypothetical protein
MENGSSGEATRLLIANAAFVSAFLLESGKDDTVDRFLIYFMSL